MPNTASSKNFNPQYDSTRGLFVNRTIRRASTTTNEPQVIMAPLSVGTEEIGEPGDIIHAGNLRTGGDNSIIRDLNVGRNSIIAGNETVGGNITAAGNITGLYSDERLKVKIGEIDGALDKVDTLTPFYYHANKIAEDLGYDPTVREIGLSAQEVQAIMPEIVAPAPADPQYLTIRYERLVPLLVEAIKELRAEVQELKKTIGK